MNLLGVPPVPGRHRVRIAPQSEFVFPRLVFGRGVGLSRRRRLFRSVAFVVPGQAGAYHQETHILLIGAVHVGHDAAVNVRLGLRYVNLLTKDELRQIFSGDLSKCLLRLRGVDCGETHLHLFVRAASLESVAIHDADHLARAIQQCRRLRHSQAVEAKEGCFGSPLDGG